MEKNESETVIVLNDGDMAGGYFLFYSSKPRVCAKLERELGDAILENLGGGRYKVRREYLRGCPFCIRRPVNLPEAERERRRLGGKARVGNLERGRARESIRRGG